MRRTGYLAVVGALLLTACGGGGSSNPTPAAPSATATPTSAPSATPTPAPAPGAVTLAYATTFGASSGATAAPAPLAFLAETQSASITAAEASFAGPFGATSSCPSVTVSPASSASGQFTLTAVSPAATGCTVTVTGAAGQTATLAATVPAPAGVQLRWVGPGYQNQASPIPTLAGPVSIIGSGALFAATLIVSENSYVGSFTAPVASPGCGSNVAIAPSAGTGLPLAAPGNAVAFYTLTASGAVATGAGCTVSTSDAATPTISSAQIGVVVTTGSGSIQ